MQLLTNGAHLQKFIFALQLAEQAIPNFTELGVPLLGMLVRVSLDSVG